MSAAYKENGEEEVKFSEEKNEINFYRKPTSKELASCRPCRIILISLFAIVLLGLLVGSIILIAITEKCNSRVGYFQTESKSVTYQVYVKSFADSNGDGFGDLKGLGKKLDYIKSLGVNTIILSGVVNNLNFSIDANIGSMNDLKELMVLLKDNEMFSVLEFNPIVVSKDSDWFKQKSTKSDWFIMSKANNTNGWLTKDNNAAWFEIHANSSYYSYYGEQLPQLNYENDQVLQKVKEALTMWVDMGVNGILMNDVSRLTVDQSITNGGDQDQPKSHDILKEFYKLTDSKKVELWVNPSTSIEQSVKYFGDVGAREAEYVINDVMAMVKSPLDIQKLRSDIESFSNLLPKQGKHAWIAGGVNYKRIASRLSEKEAAMLNLLFLTLPQKAIVYYGDEKSLADTNDDSYSIMYWGDNSGFNNTSWLATSKPTFDPVIAFANLSKVRSDNDQYFLSAPKKANQGSVISFLYGDKKKEKILVLVNFSGSSVAVDSVDQGVKEGVVIFSVNPEQTVGKKFDAKTLGAYQMIVVKVE